MMENSACKFILSEITGGYEDIKVVSLALHDEALRERRPHQKLILQ